MRLLTTWLACGLTIVGLVGCGGGDEGKTGGDGQNVVDTKKPGDNTPKPGDETPKPGDATPKPGDTTPKPGDETPKPGDETPKPSGTADASITASLKYVQPSMMAAAVLHPKRATKSALFQALPEELDLAQPKKELGFDPQHVDRILVMWYAPTKEQLEEQKKELDERSEKGFGEKEAVDDGFDFEGKTDEEIEAHFAEQEKKFAEEEKKREAERKEYEAKPPQGGDVSFVIWFDEPVDTEAYLAANERPWEPMEEQEIGGVAGYRFGPRQSVVFSEDGKTIWGGPKPAIEQMMTAKEGSGAVYDRLAADSGNYDSLLALDITGRDDIKKMADAIINGPYGPRFPPQAQQAATAALNAALKVDAMTARADVSAEGTLATVRFEGADDAAAAEIKSAIDGLIALGRLAMFTVQFPPDLAEAAPVVGALVNGIATKSEGNAVTLTVPHPEGTVELVEKLGPKILELQEQAKLVRFKNNLKQVGIAFHNFHDVYTHMPAAVAYASADKKPLLSWRVAILPMIEQSNMYEQVNLEEPWDSEHNKEVLKEMPPVYESPGVTQPGMTTLVMFNGPRALGAVARPQDVTMQQGARFRDITDGTSNTIIAVYAAPEKAVPWAKPVDVEFDPENPLASIGRIPEDGMWALFGDGSVQKIPADIAAETFKHLVQMSDGNVVELP